MTHLIAEASKKIFVPLTVGGGIRAFTDSQGVSSTALQVADAYFRAGADKVSIGSDAVDAARSWIESKQLTGKPPTNDWLTLPLTSHACTCVCTLP